MTELPRLDAGERPRIAELRGEARLRAAIDDLADQLCVAVDGNFDFAVRGAVEDETIEKLAMLTNFVVDRARRGMAALREHNDALSQIDQAKTVFFSNASHELRTPLTLILGPIEDALARPDGALEGEALGTVHRNALRLLKLVNALLDFSRIEAGRLEAVFEPVELGALTSEIAGVFRSAVERAGLRFSVDSPPLRETVWVDREMWEKIVLNLLSNAFKYTFEGGIDLSVRDGDDAVVLEVRDSGVGIPRRELSRIFERFHRVEQSRSRTHEGFGIGLAMIQELVRLHGGSVSVSSEEGLGTAFTVTIPRGNAHLPAERLNEQQRPAGQQTARAFIEEISTWSPGPRAAASDQTSATTSVEEPHGRILLADDNADMRAYLERLLRQHWTVESAADGATALQMAIADPPDLVLSDVMMPGLSGEALVRALRADVRTSAIPIMLLSARAGDEALAEGLEAGADDYVVKPFSGRELMARVRTHLQLSQARVDAATIQRIAALLNSRLDLQDVVQTVTDEATALAGAGFGAFFYNVVDEKGERYMLYTLAGAPRHAFADFPVPRNTDLFEPTFSGRGIVRIADVTKDHRYGKNPPYYGMPKGHLPVRSYLAVPVVSRSGDVLGGLFFGHSKPGVFTERTERRVAAIANHAAIAVDNANLYAREQRARAEAEAATRAKDEFLAMLGHELRNPLSPIVTAVQLMDQQDDGASARERAVIRRQLAHLTRLVDDLLDVSRITRGKVQLKGDRVEMADVVAKAIEIASPLLEQRNHHLIVNVPRSGLTVYGDQVRLAQVVSNLLTNAAKYTPSGGEVTVSARREGEEVLLSVRDNGIGIPRENLHAIFELFTQGPQSLSRDLGGLGLGLTIVRSLVALHNGTVQAFSEGQGKGSEFVIRFPFFGEERRSEELSRATPESAPEKRKLRILVVDDNTDAADLLAVSLRRRGHVTEVAYDGLAGLEKARTFRPDIALLDIGLPVMDGYEVADRMRATDDLASTPLVAITGYGQDADRARSRAAGFNAHLVKPVDLGELENLIQSLVRTT